MPTILEIITDYTDNQKETLDLSLVDLMHASDSEKDFILNLLEGSGLKTLLLPLHGFFVLGAHILKSATPSQISILFEKIPHLQRLRQLNATVNNQSTFSFIIEQVLIELYDDCAEFLVNLMHYVNQFFLEITTICIKYADDPFKGPVLAEVLYQRWSNLSDEQQQQFFKDTRLLKMQILLLNQMLVNNDEATLKAIWPIISAGNEALVSEICKKDHRQAFRGKPLFAMVIKTLVKEECLINAAAYHLVSTAHRVLGTDELNCSPILADKDVKKCIVNNIFKNIMGQLEIEPLLLEWMLLLAINGQLMSIRPTGQNETIAALMRTNSTALQLLKTVETKFFEGIPEGAPLENFIATSQVGHWIYHHQLFLRVLAAKKPELLVRLLQRISADHIAGYLQRPVGNSEMSRFEYLLNDARYKTYIKAIYTAEPHATYAEAILVILSHSPQLIPQFAFSMDEPDIILDVLFTRLQDSKTNADDVPDFLWKLLLATIAQLPFNHLRYQELLRLALVFRNVPGEGDKLLTVVVDSFTTWRRIAQPDSEGDLKFEIEQACQFRTNLQAELSRFEARTTPVSLHRQRYHDATDSALTCQFCFDDIYQYFATKYFEVERLAKTCDDWRRYEERLTNFGEILDLCRRHRDNPETLITQLIAKIDQSSQRGNTFLNLVSWSKERYNTLLKELKSIAETKPEVVVARFDELLATILAADTSAVSPDSPTAKLASCLKMKALPMDGASTPFWHDSHRGLPAGHASRATVTSSSSISTHVVGTTYNPFN